MAKNRLMGYLPNDTPPAGQLVLLGFQHILTMFPATVVAGLFNILIGLVMRAVGKEKIDMILPPIVTGSVAAIIGFGLAFVALGQIASANLLASLVTLLMTLSIMGLGRKKLSRPRSRILIPSGPQRKQILAFCLYSGNRTRAYDL